MIFVSNQTSFKTNLPLIFRLQCFTKTATTHGTILYRLIDISGICISDGSGTDEEPCIDFILEGITIKITHIKI